MPLSIYFVAALYVMATAGCAKIVVRHIDAHTATKIPSGGYYILPRTVLTIEIDGKHQQVSESDFFRDFFAATDAGKRVLEALAQAEQSSLAQPEKQSAIAASKANVREMKRRLRSAIDCPKLQEPHVGASPAELEQYCLIKADLRELGVEVSEDTRATFRIQSATPGSAAEPDVKQVYLVELSSVWPFQDRSISLDLTETGLITAGEVEVTDKTVDVVVKTIDIAAQIASRAVLAGPGLAPTRLLPKSETARLQAVLDHAAGLVQRLRDVKSKRLSLVAGDSPNPATLPADTLDRMLKELQSVEDGVVGYFRNAETSLLKAQYRYAPKDTDTSLNLTILRVGEDGATLTGQSTGVSGPTMPDMIESSNATRRLCLLVDRVSQNSPSDLIAKRRGDFADEQGFFYRIPGEALVRVVRERAGATDSTGKCGPAEELARAVMQVAQFGVIVALPSTTFTTYNKYGVGFYKDSGALKSLKVTTRGVDPAVFDKLASSAEAVQKAKIESGDELLKLERQRKILDERKKIKDLEKELAQ